MNRKFVGLAALTAMYVIGFVPFAATAQNLSTKVEYIEIRWGGIDGTCVVFPDGHVNFFGQELKAIQRPDDVDKRAFYMTIVMNRMAAQGYEFAGMSIDEIVMKRTVPR